MRSRKQYILTKDEVHGYANFWLDNALRLEYQGRRYSSSDVISVLLIAAARVVSIFAACRDLADAPSDGTIRSVIEDSLPPIPELERRLNRALTTELPKALRSKLRMIAIDFTLIPYHGLPLEDEDEIYRSKPKSGTTHFHAYATAIVVHKGHRYTLALTRVTRCEPTKDVVQRLLRIVRQRDVKVKFVLLDKEFFSVAVITYLKRAGYAFIIPAVPRGRKPKPPKKAAGVRALLNRKHGYYQHTLQSNVGGKKRSTKVTICVASKYYQDKKTDKPQRKKLLFAVRGVRLSPKGIRETYRKRFGIETSYRQLNEARIKTTTRDPAQRLLFIAVALILRNLWVWLHFKLAKGKWAPEPRIFLELLRFKEMLLWITQVIQRLLRADQVPGIDLETYQRVTNPT